MPRSVPEWIGKTDDTSIPDRVKLRVFEKFEGICPKCTRELQPGAWDCDHAIPLIVGGQNRESNLQPLCSDPCHSRKTVLDMKLKAKVASVRKRHVGIPATRAKIQSRGFAKAPPQRKASSPVDKWRGF